VAINQGSKPNDVIYTYSEAELHSTLDGLRKSGRKWQEPIQRYKGLGEMDADQLADTTMNLAHRSLRRVTLTDMEEATRVFELLMGNEVAPRREFIVAGDGLNRERIDS
jgi:DNA gyrase subunit B